MPKYYFLSDAHLGTPVVADMRAHEQKVVAWLDMAGKDATQIFLLGDIFDFWFEYKRVVPKGYNRVLGKLCELTDKGIPVHFFIGNHDLWTFGYLEQEIGLIVHKKPFEVELSGKRFFLAHGDGLMDDNRTFKLLRKIFNSRFCQKLFAILPSSWGLGFGYAWSASNRRKHDQINLDFQGEHKEPLLIFANDHASTNNIDYYIFGHRHILLHFMLRNQSQIVILGDFMKTFSYAVFDGEAMNLEFFE